MKLGLSSYTFAWAIGVRGHLPARPMNAIALVAEAERLDVRVVQICDNLPLLALSRSELDAVEARARDSHISIEIGMRGLDAREVQAHLELAKRFRSPFLRIVVDRPNDHPGPEQVVARVKVMLPEFQKAGVKLALENHDRFTARALVEIIARTDPALVGICLDTVNSFGALEGPEIVVSTLAAYTLNLHLKDFVIGRISTAMGFTISGAPAGEGRLDIPWLLSAVRAKDANINVILETWPPFGATLDETIARERAWAETSVRNLRSHLPE